MKLLSNISVETEILSPTWTTLDWGSSLHFENLRYKCPHTTPLTIISSPTYQQAYNTVYKSSSNRCRQPTPLMNTPGCSSGSSCCCCCTPKYKGNYPVIIGDGISKQHVLAVSTPHSPPRTIVIHAYAGVIWKSQRRVTIYKSRVRALTCLRTKCAWLFK